MTRSRWAFALFALYIAVLLMLIGCASVQQPQSLDQRIAYAYSVHTAVLDAAATGVESGSLSKADGAEVLTLADQSRAILDAARLAAGAGDVSTAEGRLALAVGVLTQLQAYLHSKGVK